MDWLSMWINLVGPGACFDLSTDKVDPGRSADVVAKPRNLTATPTKKNVEEPSGYV